MAKKQRTPRLSTAVEKQINELMKNIALAQKIAIPEPPIFPELLKVAEALNKIKPPKLPTFTPFPDFAVKVSELQQWFVDFEKNGPYDKDVESIAKIGWYFNGMMLPHEFVEVITYIRANDIEKLDSFFLNHIETNITEYQDLCTNWIKEAKEIVSEAFAQHLAGNYNSSVALFLILAEIVANRLLKDMGKDSHHGIFSSQNKQPKTKKLFESDITGLYPMFAPYAPLMIFHAFNNKESNVPSRDNILHGRYLSFGTKVTSARAISLIGYVILTLDDIKRKLASNN